VSEGDPRHRVTDLEAELSRAEERISDFEREIDAARLNATDAAQQIERARSGDRSGEADRRGAGALRADCAQSRDLARPRTPARNRDRHRAQAVRAFAAGSRPGPCEVRSRTMTWPRSCTGSGRRDLAPGAWKVRRRCSQPSCANIGEWSPLLHLAAAGRLLTTTRSVSRMAPGVLS
jgi:hypothetical protein